MFICFSVNKDEYILGTLSGSHMWNKTEIKLKQNWNKTNLFQTLSHVKQETETKLKQNKFVSVLFQTLAHLKQNW